MLNVVNSNKRLQDFDLIVRDIEKKKKKGNFVDFKARWLIGINLNWKGCMGDLW
jgi:hypothetical protein